VLTVNGRITLARQRYFAKGIGSHTPLDGWLDRATASISHGVREMACRLTQASRSFAKAAENLARCAGLRLSREALRDLVEAEGRAVRAAEQAGRLTPDWDAGACFVPDERGRPTAQTRLYVGVDGFMVAVVRQAEKDARRAKVRAKRRRRGRKCRPLPRARPGAEQAFKEFRVITFYDEPAAHRLVSVTRGSSAQVGRQLRRDAGRVALGKADDKVAVVDGAEWIRRQLREQSLPLDAMELDFYHLAENVHKARRAVYGEADPKDEANPGNRFAARVLHAAKHEGFDGLDRELCCWLKAVRGQAKRKAAMGLLGYVTEREEMVAYPQFTQRGWQIGSGPTESMCKAASLRVKGVGKKWDADNAEAVMTLEALDQSGAWEKYWDLPPLLAL
jgi:hypothetical protein